MTAFLLRRAANVTKVLSPLVFQRQYNHTRNFKTQYGVVRTFHTSNIHQAAPVLGPVLVKLTAPLYRVAFLLLGRRFRKFWANLPPEQKANYKQFFTKSRNRIFGITFGFGGLSLLYYVMHLEDTPVTSRRRFMIMNHEQIETVASIQWRNMNESLEKHKLSVNHPLHKLIYVMVRRILVANQSKEVNRVKWEVNVIESDEVNAFVLANGQIYVFTGIIKAAENENELAGVLGHEIAHALLNHSGEMLSLTGFLNVFSLAVMTLLWAIIPTDGVAVAASFVQNTIEDLVIHLPYSRKLEREADEVGLLLAARACYDVRYVPRFWHRMHLKEGGPEEGGAMSWFSTHPTNKSRVKHIDELVPEALELRTHNRCPELHEFLDMTHKMCKH